MLEAGGKSWRCKANKARYKMISPERISWLETHLRGGYDEVLRSFKKCYRTRLGNMGTPAADEQGLLEEVSKAL